MKILENAYMRWDLENKFWIIRGKLWRNVGNLENISEEFWTDFVEVFWIFLWNLVNISKNCWKNFGVNVNLGKLWGIIRVILYYWFCGNYKEILKMFLWNFNEIVKKIWRNVGNTLYKFFNILMEILWHFLVNFGKNLWKIIGKIWKILYDFCFFQECSYHSVYYDCANYFNTSNKLMFQFL